MVIMWGLASTGSSMGDRGVPAAASYMKSTRSFGLSLVTHYTRSIEGCNILWLQRAGR
jgi:hypothetical protein